jgi:predicted protein tyrosine phosphatase
MPSTFPEVIVASRTEAGELMMSTRTGPAIKHVISIGDPGEPPPAGYAERPSRLRLIFYDVDEDTDFEFGPERHHVQAIISFARRIASAEGQLLVHCSAGVSRSAAAALTVYATWLGAGRENEAVEAMFRAAPGALPNLRLVGLADELLGRGGALLRALENVGWS